MKHADKYLMRQLISFIICTLFIFQGCTTKKPEAVTEDVPAQNPAESEPHPDLPRVLLPLQSAYVCNTENGNFDRALIVMHFDRRDAYSVLPQRLVLSPGKSNTIVPVAVLGKKGLVSADTVILRTARTRYGLMENEYSPLAFDIKDAVKNAVPEFIVFSALIDSPLYIRKEDCRNKRNGIRKGPDDLLPESKARLTEGLSNEQLLMLSRFFEQSRVFTDYEGIHSAVFLPYSVQTLPDYTDGLGLRVNPGRDFDMSDWSTYRDMDISFSPVSGRNEILETISLGDMGVFSGGTVLLEPDLVTHTRKMLSTANIVAMPAVNRTVASPITMAGSFNIYRDERNRYLWYPGIISYIPGNHPDISDNDVQIVFDTERRALDAFLLDSGNVYFGTQTLPGGLPVFFLAAPSARDLELAYERNEEVRAELEGFLEQPAHTIRLF